MTTSTDDPDLIVVLLDQVNISVCNTTPAVTALRTLLTDPTRVRHFAGRVTFAFHGYDGQTDELYQNPIVCTFVERLTEQFPYWFHFVRKDDDALFVLVMCLLGPDGVTAEHQPDGRVRLDVSPSKFNEVVMTLFEHMNGLYADNGLSDEENSAMTQKVKSWLNRIMGE